MDPLSDLNLTVVTDKVEKVFRNKRSYNQRPDQWRDIAQDYLMHKDMNKTCIKYKLFERNHDRDYWYKTLSRWIGDFQKDTVCAPLGRKPVYGTHIDMLLADKVENYFTSGVPITNYILKFNLLEILRREKDTKTLSMYESGKYTFGDSWAGRFYKRHSFRNRVVTTKMRDSVPADYEKKMEQYLRILAATLANHNIPKSLILGVDETNSQFIPSVKHTRCRKGTKRVRLIGVGKEKPQITVTVGASATGDLILPAQLIFGGTTRGCHPDKGKTPAPEGQYFAHSKSHWQTDDTFVNYIADVIVPYKDRIIEAEALPSNQKTCLIMDLHWSHKTAEVLTMLNSFDIIPVFIPAGCTHLHQVCDLVMNKPYKNAVVNNFITYVAGEFEKYVRDSEEGGICKLNMALSVMKPLIPGFVAAGLSALRTPAMIQTIRNSFISGGLVDRAREPNVIAAARENMDALITVPTEVEAEEDLGPIEAEGDVLEEFDVQPAVHTDDDVVDDETDMVGDTKENEAPADSTVHTDDDVVDNGAVNFNLSGGNNMTLSAGTNMTFNINNHVPNERHKRRRVVNSTSRQGL